MARRLTSGRWAAMSEEARAAHAAKTAAAWAAKYPERAALVKTTRQAIESGELMPRPCDNCGEVGSPLFDWSSLSVRGWRCVPCKKLLRRGAVTRGEGSHLVSDRDA